MFRDAARALTGGCCAALVMLAACPSGGDGDAGPEEDGGTSLCPNDLPGICPDPAPSFSGDIVPALDRTCRRCHGAGLQAADKPLTSYDEVFRRRGAVLNQIFACTMPPPDAGLDLTADERAAFLGWLVCGAPEN